MIKTTLRAKSEMELSVLVSNYLKEYPEDGYGTQVTLLERDEEGVSATMIRAEGCE